MIPVVLARIAVLDRESIYRGLGLEWISLAVGWFQLKKSKSNEGWIIVFENSSSTLVTWWVTWQVRRLNLIVTLYLKFWRRINRFELMMIFKVLIIFTRSFFKYQNGFKFESLWYSERFSYRFSEPIRARLRSANQRVCSGHQFENPFQHSYKRKKGFTPEKQKLLSHDREKEAKKSAKNTALGQLLGNAPILPTQPRIVD